MDNTRPAIKVTETQEKDGNTVIKFAYNKLYEQKVADYYKIKVEDITEQQINEFAKAGLLNYYETLIKNAEVAVDVTDESTETREENS